jgi:voltage-gated potassium channel
MNKAKIEHTLNEFRFEFLLAALLLVLFDRAFVTDEAIYTGIVWPVNMILLGLASWSIFREKIAWIRWLRTLLFLLSVLIPLAFGIIAQYNILIEMSFLVYVVYYSIIFSEVLRQIFQRSEATVSVILGSISGFLLMIVIAQFAFLQLEFSQPGAFNGLEQGSIPSLYNQLSYFSMVTMATVGYGDIAPKSETARLVTMFFTIAAQFYMVALVGIIVSRFSARTT